MPDQYISEQRSQFTLIFDHPGVVDKFEDHYYFVDLGEFSMFEMR